MPRAVKDVIRDIERFDSIHDGWPKLDVLINELKAAGPIPVQGIDALLCVFERHPGASALIGPLMTVLHTLEAVPGYEPHVIESLRRKPSILAVMIVNRMLNSDVTDVGGHSLMQLLEDIKANPRLHRGVQAEIESVLEGRPS